MQGLGFRKVQRGNRADGRSGTPFEGRFRSSQIEDDRYFLACQRYIELNPARAGLVADPGAYPARLHGKMLPVLISPPASEDLNPGARHRRRTRFPEGGNACAAGLR